MTNRFLLIAIISLSLVVPSAEAFVNPTLDWRTIETDHFLVHFPQRVPDEGGRVAAIAEEAYLPVTGLLGHEPKGKTHIVLNDEQDVSNGFATPFPFHRIEITLTPPVGMPFSLTDRTDWLKIVVIHEFTHIVHFDMASGVPKLIRNIFGNVYFPTALQPRWLSEGLATRVESELTDGGREGSPYTRMLIRQAIAEDRFPHLSQAGNFSSVWPAGAVPYQFGVEFYRWLSDKYGEEMPKDFAKMNASRTIPLLIDSSARRVFNSTFRKEWQYWQDDLTIDACDRCFLTPSVELSSVTTSGYRNLKPSLSPDGRYLIYSSEAADRLPSLILRDLNKGEEMVVITRTAAPGAEGVAWSSDSSGFYYSATEADRFGGLSSEIYHYQLESRKIKRLTTGAHSGSPTLSPDGDTLLAPIRVGSSWQLASYNLEGKELARFVSDDGSNLFDPDFSPDGEQFVVVAGGNNFAYRLELWTADGVRLSQLAVAGSLVSDPIWTLDGGEVIYSAARDGRFGIYSYDLNEDETRQLTQVAGGAFDPAPSADGKELYFANYSARGFDLVSMRRPEGQPIEPLEPIESVDHAIKQEPAPRQAQVGYRSYRPGRELLPSHWIPWYGFDEAGTQLGALTTGADALERHNYAISLFRGLESERTAYSLLYRYQGAVPFAQILASDQSRAYADLLTNSRGEGVTYWEREKFLGVDLIIPGVDWQYLLGLRHEQFSALAPGPPAGDLVGEGELTGLLFSLLYDSTSKTMASISPEDGRMVTLSARFDAEEFGSKYRLNRYRLDWREYLSLPKGRDVLLLTATGMASSGDLLARGAFRIGGDNSGDILNTTDMTRRTLRGYGQNRILARDALYAGAEYRFLISDLERGPGNGALFFKRMHAALFFEGVEVIGDDASVADDWYDSAGIELRLDMNLAYLAPITFRTVLVRGLDDQYGESQAYFALQVGL